MSLSMETEKENKLSFLDVKIIRKQGKSTTTIYRKPTFSGVYSNFKSLFVICPSCLRKRNNSRKKAFAPSPSILRNNIFAN